MGYLGQQNRVLRQPDLSEAGDWGMKILPLIFGIFLLVGTAGAISQYNLTVGSDAAIIFNGTGGSINWSVPSHVSSIEFLSVAGGASAGASVGYGSYSGGGGAGGYLNGTIAVTPGEVLNITIGDGGLTQTTVQYAGNSGGNSSISNSTTTMAESKGGGGGAGYDGQDAVGGGSGGGGAYNVVTAGTGIAGQGYAGGNGNGVTGAGGGGGANSTGAIGTTIGGLGGSGKYSDITGTNTLYSVGGDGGGRATNNMSATYIGSGGHGTNNTGLYGGAGSAGIVVIRYERIVPSVSFTSNVTGGYPPTVVLFNDTSVTDITSWNWSYRNTTPGNNTKIIFSTDQNVTQSFGVGHWHIGLNVTNASGFAETDGLYSITVSDSGGLLGWNRQDIMMDEIFEFILNVKDARTLSGIPGATAATSNGDNSTTDLFGVVTFSTNYTALVITVGAEGYYSRSVSYVVDRDREETIYLTELPGPVPPPVLNTYTMHPVRIKVVDAWGTPLPHSAITVNYLASTLPSTDTIWLASAFGISTTVATEMTTSSLAMVGSTANDGALTFMMFPALTYGLTITNATIGLNNYQELSPRDTDYVIYCPLASQGQVNNTLTAAVASSLPFYQLNASGGYNLSMIYQDTAGYTTNVRFQVIDYSAGSVLVYDNDLGNPGTGIITDNYTVLVPLGQEYIWRYNATKV